MKKRVWIMAILMVGTLAAGCGGASKDTMSAASVTEETSADYGAYENEAWDDVAEDGAVTAESGIEIPTNTSQKLIKTVTLNMETREFETVLSGIQAKVTETGGYTETSEVNGSSYYGRGNRSAWLTLRIPADKLDTFVTTVSGLGNVTSKSESVEDITLQYVDTESHKKALETEQDRLLTLMEQAESMDDIIKIETRLSEIRYELQTYETTLRTYDNQVSYSTVNIDLYEVDRESAPEKQSFASELKTRLTDNIYHISRGLRSFAIWFAASLPYFAIFAAAAFIVIKIVRKIVWKKPIFHKKEEPTDPTSKE
ncbi:MAG: DUF4349 domain-containing protein [Lachnospiraceae bacterium]|nr:DUF4349 domain-containing protein [Lachnospiraceae bacterium]